MTDDPSVDQRPKAPRSLIFALSQLLITAAWVGVHLLSESIEYAPHASLWYPPAALTFAAFALLGLRAVPALVAAGVVVTFLTAADYGLKNPPVELAAAGVLFMVVHGLAYYGLVTSLRAVVARHGPQSVLRLVFTFLIGGAMAAALAAGLGIAVLTAFGMFDPSTTTEAAVAWLIGDFAGLVTLAPLFMLAMAWLLERSGVDCDRTLLSFDGLASAPTRRQEFIAKLTVTLGAVVAILCASALLRDHEPVVFVLFLVIILQNWIVHTEGALRSILSLAGVSLVVVALTALLGLGDRALVLQFAILTLAASTYFGLSVPQLYADNARLRLLLTQDTLTGAASRHHFIELSARGIEQAVRDRQPASLIMVDLDHLKQINDTLGHTGGDCALRELVARIKSNLRPQDLVGRLGGDEFSIFMPGVQLDRAFSVAQTLKRSIENVPIGNGEVVRLSASFGVAEIRPAADTLEHLMERADNALYEAKKGGRNQVAMG